MYTLRFTLKQHTPLIHFQHDQDGATLRASEVKPKLDRFLIQKFIEANPVIDYKKWLIGNGDNPALDYKMKIVPEKETKAEDETLKFTQNDFGKWKSDYPMLLANMGLKETKEEFRQFSFFEKHQISFNVYNKSLKDKIKELLPHFFATHNFGNRHTKGFGSFTVSGVNENGIFHPIPVPQNIGIYFLEITTINTRKVFEAIDYYWKRLKSGINYSDVWDDPNKYKKSELFNHINSLPAPYTWEKRWLKEKFYGLPPSITTNTPKFARALLGLPDKFEFVRNPQKNGIRKKKYHEIEGDYLNSLKWTIGVTHPTIDRIPSPIVFKPIKEDKKTVVYLLFQQQVIPANDSAQSFLFSPAATNEIKYNKNGRQQPFKMEFTFKSSEERQVKANNYLEKLIRLKDSGAMDELNFIKAKGYLERALQYTLDIPTSPLNLIQLIDGFHKELGNQFTAIDFRGNSIAKVTVVNTKKL